MKKCILIIIALIYSFLGVQMLFAVDTIPNQFKFTAKTKAALNTVCTSNTIKVSGIDTATPISIVGGEYSIKGGPYTSASGIVMNGNTVNVQQTSAGIPSTTTDATLTIGGVFATFSVTTVPADTEPKNFKFTDQKNVPLSTPITSNTITVTGINTATPISIVGGTYAINGGSYTSTSSTVNNNDTVTVQQTSSDSFSTMTMATLTIGGVSGTFGVKTLAADPKPDKFIFIPQTNVGLSTVITSNAITVSGINAPAPISIVGGTYSINGGPYTSAPGTGTVNDGDTVTVQQTSSGSYNKKTTATLIIGKVKGAFSVTTLTFTQADLKGTWNMHGLTTGQHGDATPKNEWRRARITINDSGVATCLSYHDSEGGTTCPSPFALKFTMHTTTGVITESGANASTNSHMTMTSNKNFMVGTGTEGSPSYNLIISQKEVPETVYMNADVWSQSFVFHQLEIVETGMSIHQWRYGAGTIGSSGAITQTSLTTPGSGTDNTPTSQGTASVDSDGVVTMAGDSGTTNFNGFLSDDKKTIVGTQTHGDSGHTQVSLVIIQITGTEFTVGALPAGIAVSHMLGAGTGVAFWAHDTVTVAPGGSMTFSDWASSFGGSAPVGTYTGNITDTSGTLLIDGNPTFHGQISHDEKFTVGTQTPDTDVYMLSVSTQ